MRPSAHFGGLQVYDHVSTPVLLVERPISALCSASWESRCAHAYLQRQCRLESSDLRYFYISIEDTATYLNVQISEVRHTGDETLAQLPGLKHTGLTAPEPCDRGERPSRTAIRWPSLGVIPTAALIERPQRPLCKAKIAVHSTASALSAHVYSTIGGNGVLRSHDIEKSYPFDCGSHAVNTPGSGLVDFKVHVASSHDTQSALISNVELELRAPLATPKKHTLAKANAARLMAVIRGPECEGAIHNGCIISVKGGAGVVRENQTLMVWLATAHN